MQITIAKNAGFCFGVKRATDRLEAAIESKREGERIYTLGNLIHNAPYNQSLSDRGVGCISIADVERVAADSSEGTPVTVFIRAHGIPKEDEALLKRLSEEREGFTYIDCTCPYVKKIHRIAEENSKEGNVFVLFGAENHPEVVGIMSYFEGEKTVIGSSDEVVAESKREFLEKNRKDIDILTSFMVTAIPIIISYHLIICVA